MERWLLISNCQTTGLAQSFQLLNRSFDVKGLDIWGYLLDPARWDAEMADYYRVVISPEIESFVPNGFLNAPNLTKVPAVSFAGFHPDICYVSSPIGMVRGPLGNYNSLIAFAAFKRGLSVEDTRALFNGAFFEKCGYFDYWEPQKDALLKYFMDYGIDLSEPFLRWSRKGAFMYSTDHPKIDVLYDVAKSLLKAGNVDYQESGLRPPDLMVNGPCWPVYPEIGEALGVEGCYVFKRDMLFHHTNLTGFIQESFLVYDNYPIDELTPAPEYQAIYDHVSGMI